ncbi:MAG: hypothetical protein ACR2M2_03570 [Gaiellaceae bacterium]
MVSAHAKAHRRAWAAGSHAILATPERLRHVGYVIIGGFALVIQGIDALTQGPDLVPSVRAENCAGSRSRSQIWAQSASNASGSSSPRRRSARSRQSLSITRRAS